MQIFFFLNDTSVSFQDLDNLLIDITVEFLILFGPILLTPKAGPAFGYRQMLATRLEAHQYGDVEGPKVFFRAKTSRVYASIPKYRKPIAGKTGQETYVCLVQNSSDLHGFHCIF